MEGILKLDRLHQSEVDRQVDRHHLNQGDMGVGNLHHLWWSDDMKVDRQMIHLEIGEDTIVYGVGYMPMQDKNHLFHNHKVDKTLYSGDMQVMWLKTVGGQVKLSLLPISLNSFYVSFSIVSQMLFDYLLSFSQANHLLICNRVLQNLIFVFCFFLYCEQDKILQSTGRGHMVNVMKNGAAI